MYNSRFEYSISITNITTTVETYSSYKPTLKHHICLFSIIL